MAATAPNCERRGLERLCSGSLNDEERWLRCRFSMNSAARSTARALGLARLIEKRLGNAATELHLDVKSPPIRWVRGMLRATMAATQ